MNRIFIFLLFSTILINAQAQKDTLEVVEYLQTAQQLIENNDTSTTALATLSEAYNFYSDRPFSTAKLKLNALYTYALTLKGDYHTAENIANTIITYNAAQSADANYKALAYAYRSLQLIYYDRDYRKSIDFGRLALKGFAPNTDIYFEIAENVIRNYGYLGELNQAKLLITDLENLLIEQPNSSNSIVVYKAKMQYFLLTKNYEKAIIFGNKLFKENESFQKYTANKLATMYVEMGNAYLGLKNYDEAATWMQKGVKAAPYDQNQPIIGTYLANMANIYSQKRDFTKAADYYEKSKILLAKDTARFAQSLKIVYINLGSVYYNINDFKKAEQNLKTAIYLGAKDPNLDLNLANILGKQERYEEALALIQSALLQVTTTFSNTDFKTNPSPYEQYSDPKSIGYILISKGVYLHRLGKQQQDITLMKMGQATLDLAIKTYKDNLAAAKGFEDTKFAINSGVLLTLGYKLANQYEIYKLFPTEDNLEAIFEMMEQRKAMLLLETLTPTSLPDSIFQQERQLIDNIQQIGQSIDLAKAQNNKDAAAYYEQQLFDANQDLEDFMATIQQKYLKESQGIYHINYATTSQIQSTINEQTLVISYSYYQSKGFISTISKSGKNIYTINPTSIDKNIKRLNQLIQDPFSFQKPIRDEFIDLSHELYNILLAPIEAELTDKTQLMVIQEGKLFNLPFEVLLATNDKKPYHDLDFLIKKYAINYHYSATAYLQLQAKPTPQNGSILAFAPVFERGGKLSSATRSLDFMNDSLYRSFDNDRFAALPNTQKEVNAIATLFNNKTTTMLLKRKATKNNLQAALENQPYQFIHIATHGIVNFKNPKLSALACYSTGDKMDNLFYANAIQRSNLNADLVVLSSCESGIGQLVEGEGLIALNRSFFYAGAKNVLFSLWKVNDEYSSDLMIDFYKNYLTTPSYTKALRAAKLNLIAHPSTALPSYWAAFVLMGE